MTFRANYTQQQDQFWDKIKRTIYRIYSFTVRNRILADDTKYPSYYRWLPQPAPSHTNQLGLPLASACSDTDAGSARSSHDVTDGGCAAGMLRARQDKRLTEQSDYTAARSCSLSYEMYF